MDGNSEIELPDLEPEGMKEIHACLETFGLNDGEFTFAPAIGGVLVYDKNAGFIWFPRKVMQALGVSSVESKENESIGNYAAEVAGKSVGGAIGGTLSGAATAGVMLIFSRTLRTTLEMELGGTVGQAAKAAKLSLTVLGFSKGLLAIPIFVGAYFGQLVGKKVVRKFGFNNSSYRSINTIYFCRISRRIKKCSSKTVFRQYKGGY